MTDLYLGTMDGYGWYNNSGEFRVELGIRSPNGTVPEGGSFAGVYAFALGLMGYSLAKKKRATT